MAHRKRQNNQNGFTLAELLIVVAIIAVLVAVAIPVFNTQLEKAREAVDIANMRAAESFIVTLVTEDPSKENMEKYMTYEPRLNCFWATFDVGTGGLYHGKDDKDTDYEKKLKGYGKGTKLDGGTRFDGYDPEEDYTNAFVEIHFYYKKNTQIPDRIELRWKKKGSGSNEYFVGKDKNKAKTTIVIPLG